MSRVFEQPVEIKNGYLGFEAQSFVPATAKVGKLYLYQDPVTGLLMVKKSGASTAYEVYDANEIATILGPLVQAAQVTVTSAQLLALHTTPVALVPAPGAGNVIQFLGALVTYVYGTTAYTINSSTNLAVQFTDGSGATASSTLATTGVIDQTTNQVRQLSPVATTLTPVANAALVLSLAVASPTLGDGTLSVRTLYRVLPTP